VLQRFVEALHQDGKAGVAGADGGDREAARALLLRALDDAMAADEGVARLPAVVREARRRALASGLDGKGPRGVLAAWLLQRFDDPAGTEMVAAEWSFDRVAVGPIQLRGRADRVDRLPSGDLWVVDYKTGTPPDAKRIGKGLVAQGLVYSDAAKAAYSAPAAAAVYQPLKKPSEAGRGGWIGDRAALAAAGAGKDALELDGEQGRAVREHQRGAAEKLAAGRFHTTLAGAEDAGCRYCDFAKICRVDHARNARIAEAGDPRWLLPIEDPA
jgi:hypothetical protein